MRYIFILCMLLSSLPALGQIDGKGIFCALETASDGLIKEFYEDFNLNGINVQVIKAGVFFNEGKSFPRTPSMENDVIFYFEGKSEEYEVTQNHIIIEETGYLDRKTLILSDTSIGSIQCEVFDSKSSFDKEAERLLVILQAAYDNQRVGNRI
jgi:hypothetical protein